MKNNSNNFSQKITYPMLVSSISGTKDSSGEILKRWERFDNIPEHFRDTLTSKETPNVIKEICSNYHLSIQDTEEISRIVRSLFFGDILQENLVNEIQKRIPVVGSNNAQDIARIIIDKIVNATPTERKTGSSASFVNLPLSQALQKYPRLGEQLVTANPIKLKILPGSLRPSIKNWITDYHQALGAVSHGTIERGNYLYHSENAKRLTAGERQKLAVVLKSLDENEAVSVDADKQEIVFQNKESEIRNQESGREKPKFGFLRKREIPESQFTVTKQISDSMPPVRDESGIRNQESGARNQGNIPNSDKMRFSSPQRFSRPAPPPPPVPPKPAPTPKPEYLPPRPLRSQPAPEVYEHYRPYKITHLSHEEPEEEKKPEPKINGNVVDLSNRNQESGIRN